MLEQLSDILSHLHTLRYEALLAIGSIVVLVVGMISKSTYISRVLYATTLIGAAWSLPVTLENEITFGGYLVTDQLSYFFKLLFSLAAIWVVFFPKRNHQLPEFYFLLLATIAGSALMLSANHLIIIYMSIELASFASYVVTNFHFRKTSFEAGIKYLLYGGVSAAVALYGASLLYGLTGTMVLSDMKWAVIEHPLLANLAIALFMVGVIFKASLVPAHSWVPSTYQETPSDAVAIFSTVPKIAGFVLLHRLVVELHELMHDFVYQGLIVLGIVTIVTGTLGAIRQQNAKRLISYGAIANSGFLFMPIFIASPSGAEAFIWFAVIYTIMNIALFYLIAIFEQQGIFEIQSYAGLMNSQAYLGIVFTTVLLAMIGLPPTAGFSAKFILFTSALEWFQNAGNEPLFLVYVIVAILSVVISLYFYMRIPYFYFLKEGKQPLTTVRRPLTNAIATIFLILLLWIFFDPGFLNSIIKSINLLSW